MDTLLIAAAVIPAVVLLIQVYRADRLEKEPASLLLWLVLLGVAAMELAALTEREETQLLRLLLPPDSALYNLIWCFAVVAFSEEGFKYLLLRRKTWHSPEFNCTFDGVVYSAFLSLGFALWENIHYVLFYGLSAALARAVTAVPGHACFGVFMGTWYGLAKRAEQEGNHREKRRRNWLSLLIPLLIHGGYDYIALVQSTRLQWLFIGFVGVLFFASLVVFYRMAYRDTYI